MKITSPYEKYKRQSVMGASPGELTLMLYEGCLKFLKLAKSHMEDKNIQEAHNNLIKAGDIISELMATLDTNYDIAAQIMRIYIYIFEEIREANIKKDSGRISGVIELVEEFKDAWGQAVLSDRARRFSEGRLN